MYTLKSIARRGTSFVAALALVVSSVGAAVLPAVSAYADALNPLTNRSLTLSSSAPGWDFTDGSGNATYAPPNSGANGQKTGNYFDFRVSSGTNVRTMTFQYCKTSAGDCEAPGDNGCKTGTTSGHDCVRKTNAEALADGDKTSDLDIVNDSAVELSSLSGIVNTGSANGDIVDVPGGDIAGANGGTVPGNSAAGNFAVYYESAPSTWTQSTGWTLTVDKSETGSRTEGDGFKTGKNNRMILTKVAPGQALTAGQRVKVVFFASDTKFWITNPGSSWFFVKINTYNKSFKATAPDSGAGEVDKTGLQPDTEANVIDGGVTVANVMNHSIRIQTKVLETMEFSVGTVDPNSLPSNDGNDDLGDPGTNGPNAPSTYEKALYADTTGLKGATKHTTCNPILGGMAPDDAVNVLKMGNTSAENSLEVAKTYATHSYWRLSSNSSAGATVYYSGNTLSNTVGDKIREIGATKALPAVGSEQFGLALAVADNTGDADEGTWDGTGTMPAGDLPLGVQKYSASYATEATYEQGADDTVLPSTTNGVHASTLADTGSNDSWHLPRLYPLTPKADYGDGRGVLNGTPSAQFAFQSNSTLVPVPIADENSQVVDCVTGKMRYIANIAATTPAGIYTTAINYIAAPQY